MKLRDEVRSFGQGMRARTAYPTSKYGVGYRVVSDTHPSGAQNRGSSTTIEDASLDLVGCSLCLYAHPRSVSFTCGAPPALRG